MSRCAKCVSANIRSLPQRSQVIRSGQLGNAANASPIASAAVGSGSVAYERQQRSGCLLPPKIRGHHMVQKREEDVETRNDRWQAQPGGVTYSPRARRAISRNSSIAASPRRWCSSASISCTGPNRVELLRDAVMIADFRAACGGSARAASRSAIIWSGPIPCFGRGFFAVTMRGPVMVAGCAGCFRSVIRLGDGRCSWLWLLRAHDPHRDGRRPTSASVRASADSLMSDDGHWFPAELCAAGWECAPLIPVGRTQENP